MNRRQLLYGTGAGLVSGMAARAGGTISSPSAPTEEQAHSDALSLSDYQPTSMLHTRESHVERARFPVIDVHTHITETSKSTNGVEMAAEDKWSPGCVRDGSIEADYRSGEAPIEAVRRPVAPGPVHRRAERRHKPSG